MIKNCKNCQKEFQGFSSQKFCSIFCRLKFNSKQLGNGCWECTLKSCDKKGYPRLEIDRRTWIASRAMFKYFFDFDPGYDCVCHTCDNPKCINPNHLFLGTYKDNAQDCLKKGRWRDAKGSKNGFNKLNELDVKQIKNKISEGNKLMDISKQFSVSHQTIWLISKQKTWKHVRS